MKFKTVIAQGLLAFSLYYSPQTFSAHEAGPAGASVGAGAGAGASAAALADAEAEADAAAAEEPSTALVPYAHREAPRDLSQAYCQKKAPQHVLDFFRYVGRGVSSTARESFESLKDKAILTALKVYARYKIGKMEDRDLAPEARSRVRGFLSNPVLSNTIYPFAKTVMGLYHLPGSLKKTIKPKGEKAKTETKSRLPFSPTHPRVLGKVFKLMDAFVLQKDSIDITRPYEPNEPLIANVSGVLEEIIREVVAILPETGDPSKDEYRNTLTQLLASPDKLEAASTALVQVLDRTLFLHYTMLENQRERIRRREEAYLRMLDEGGDELFRRFDEDITDRKYTLQFMLDGLPNLALVRGLCGGTSSKVLRALGQEDAHREHLRPKQVESVAAPEMHTELLQKWARGDVPELRRDDYLPFLKGLLQNPHKAMIEVATVASPTISVKMLPQGQTGDRAYVTDDDGNLMACTGIPAFQWLDKKANGGQGRGFYGYGSDAIELAPFAEAHGMRTIPQKVNEGLEATDPNAADSLNCFGPYGQGYQCDLRSILNVGTVDAKPGWARAVVLAELRVRAKNHRRIRELKRDILGMQDILSSPSGIDGAARALQRSRARSMIKELASLEDRTLPQITHVYDPEPDHNAHFKGPFSDEILGPNGKLNKVDRYLQDIMEIFKAAGIEDRTLFGIVGDHGLVPNYWMVNPLKLFHDHVREHEGGLELIEYKVSSDEGEGPKIYNSLHPRPMRGHDIFVGSTAGGNLMLGFPEQKDDTPLYANLINITPINDPSKRINVLQHLLASLGDSLDYLVVRETPVDARPSGGGTVRLMRGNPEDKEGEPLSAFVTRRGGKYFYDHTAESDLLKVRELDERYEDRTDAGREAHQTLLRKCVGEAERDRPDSWCTEQEWRLLTSYTPKPDSVVQILRMKENPLAGAVNLFPADGVGYNTVVPGRHAGEHAFEKRTTACVWGTPLENEACRARLGLQPETLKAREMREVPLILTDFLTGQEAV